MMVSNVHERVLRAAQDRVGALVDSLSSANDRLWPDDKWPPMRFDGGLAVGSKGGHGPVRYFVEAYDPGREIVFRFSGPSGFRGTHSFKIHLLDAGTVSLRHELHMNPRGAAVVTWPLFFRPLHDALIEDSLDRAERELFGRVEAPQQWSRYVKLLRWAARWLRRKNRRRR